MSYDLAAWSSELSLNDKEASELYFRLCEGDTSSLLSNPAIKEMYNELTDIHPELSDLPDDDIDDSPWNSDFDTSHGHILICCAWNCSEYCYELFLRLAAKHNLAVFDPQSTKIIYP